MSDAHDDKLISVQKAIDIIDRTAVQPRIVRVRLSDADGMRLATDVSADRDYPPFAKSLMDGYAVQSAGASALSDLRVVGEIAAGASSDHELQTGEAIAIMTGAPIPRGADGVVPVEEIEKTGENAIRVRSAGKPSRYIAKQGSDVTKGTIVAKAGTMISPQQIAVLSTVGAWEVDVFDRPRVAVLSTGNELAGEGQQPGEFQIRNSNGPMLVSLLRRLGCIVEDWGIHRDDPNVLRGKIGEAMSRDAVFISGGMSMGEYDYVPKVLTELGVELKITKLRIKPGKPFVFGVRDNRYAFGLPGNPVSAFVCTMRLASRLLTHLAGGEVQERWQAGRLDAGMLPNGPREFYQPVIRTNAAARNSSQSVIASIKPLTWKGSADLFTLASANALLVRGENEPALPMGTVVRVLEI